MEIFLILKETKKVVSYDMWFAWTIMKNVRLLHWNLNKKIEVHAKDTIEISMSTFENKNKKFNLKNI
jgi:hypothetical protein